MYAYQPTYLCAYCLDYTLIKYICLRNSVVYVVLHTENVDNVAAYCVLTPFAAEPCGTA